MATIVNNPQPVESHNSGVSFLVGVILLIVFAYMLFVYGLPYLQSSMARPQVTIPSDINVDINRK